jgi:membrane-bound metal-dependent hydrolase YbcI (DUF457 family)
MYKEGHFGLGLLASSFFAIPAIGVGNPVWGVLIALAGIAGGLLPDIDNKPLIPCKHHGYTHTVLFGVVSGVFITGGVLGGFYSAVQILSRSPLTASEPTTMGYIILSLLLYSASIAGVVSHLLGDALSTAGGTLLIRPWKPVSDNHIRFGVTTAGNPVYNHTFFLAGVIAYIGLFMSVY